MSCVSLLFGASLFFSVPSCHPYRSTVVFFIHVTLWLRFLLAPSDKAALEWARPGAERKLSLSLPYLSCSSSSCSIQNPIEGALQILAFLNALLVTVYASFAADEQRESSDTT